jgi:flavodoxin
MTTMSAASSRIVTRRALLGGIAGLAVAGLAACTRPPLPTASPATGSAMPTPSTGSRVLVAYFSRAGENYWNGGRRDLETGNTEVLAGLISERIDCDVYGIEAAEPYSDRYDPTVQRNVAEQNADARPAIAGALPDLSGYDTVLLGSPIWNVQPPMIMATFVEAVDLTGTSLHPFVTYAVSGLGSTASFYRDLNTGADLHDGLAIRGEEVREPAARADVDQWLRAAGLIER